MKIKQAIGLVKSCGLNIDPPDVCNECEQLIISALEKQIPKRVEGNDYVVRYCPNCGVCISDEYNSFCEKCDQALDWGYTE